MSRRVLIAALGLIGLGGTAALGAGPSDQEVAKAIAQGVSFLRNEQEPGGSWSYRFNSDDHQLGITALAGLALLENGVEPSNAAVVKAKHAVIRLSTHSVQTYDLALAILFLARAEGARNDEADALIQKLGRRLEGGGPTGIWSYTVPLRSEDDAISDRRAQRLAREIFPSGFGDNSNTQFALLGIWAAGRHGLDPNAALERIDQHFRTTQQPDARWGYRSVGGTSESMTCAGLMGLAIASARPKLAERQNARSRGAALAADPVFAGALKAVSQDARRIGPSSDIYHLWSLERVCVALGLRQLDGFDWYAAGAEELLRRQEPDGSWPEHGWGKLPNTCLSLLFLRKANLAFELDRVLKLPEANHEVKKPVHLALAEPDSGDEKKPDSSPSSDATVVVTGASDKGFPKITVDFEIKKPDGSFLLDAGQDDMQVTEEGRPVPILEFQAPTTREARPITVVLVVDRSRSMEEEDRIGGLKKAVASFVAGLPAGSRVAVISFGSDVEVVCPFTSDTARVRRTVEVLTPAGATRYYDAVAEAIELLTAENGRRAVLALTDGEDTFSQSATLESVIAAARKLGVPVHTLGLGTEDEIASDELGLLARSTRGAYYSARQADQLRRIYEQLAERLRSSYTLAYRTDRAIPDGTLRPVRVSYRASKSVGETAVFIPGMVVPAAGWSGLFLLLVAGLVTLGALPKWIAGRGARG